MQRLMSNLYWTLYITDPEEQAATHRIQRLFQKLHERVFGCAATILIVIERDHPAVMEYVKVIMGYSVKKFCWDRQGDWLFLTVDASDLKQMEELKDHFINISNRHVAYRHRGQLECHG